MDEIDSCFTFSDFKIGFTNSIIYTRPRFLKIRREFPHMCLGWSIWHTLIRTRPSSSSSLPPRRHRGRGGPERINRNAAAAAAEGGLLYERDCQ